MSGLISLLLLRPLHAPLDRHAGEGACAPFVSWLRKAAQDTLLYEPLRFSGVSCSAHALVALKKYPG